MSFFEQYFAALDGADPFSSLEFVADDVQFCIHWSNDGSISEFTGGREDLRRFIEAGDDWRNWRHHILWSARDGDTEFAAGETRYGDGRPIGTYMVFAQLDEDGRMVRYFAARTPVTDFRGLGTDELSAIGTEE
jgi:SnoaL-like domain